jgi:hypothetical protein
MSDAREPKKSPFEFELLANMIEAREAVVDGQPPVDAPGTIIPADQVWIPVEDRFPLSHQVMEVWDTARDTIEKAHYHAGSRLWYSQQDGFQYLFGGPRTGESVRDQGPIRLRDSRSPQTISGLFKPSSVKGSRWN